MTVRLGALVAALSLSVVSTAALTASGPTAAAPAQDTGDPGLVTLELQADGDLRVVASLPADVELPSSEPHAASDADTFVVEVLDASGRATYRRSVEVEQEIRADLPAEGSDEFTGLTATPATVTFTVALPTGGDTAVRVDHDGTTTTAVPLAAPAAAARAGGAPEVVKLRGYPVDKSTNRLDMVIVGDGYTADQKAKFRTDARKLVNGIVKTSPFEEYAGLFNFVGVFAPSAQSGIDQPPYSASAEAGTTHPIAGCSDATAPTTGRYVDSRYDSSFCYNGTQRLMVPIDTGQIYTDANAAYPRWDHIVMVANATTYGGSGGAIASSTLDPSGVEVLKHELGHSLMWLDDEYTTYTAGYPPCSDKRREGITDRCAANVTDVTQRGKIKWKRWIERSTKIPTQSPKKPGVVGLFLGAHYSPDTWYRSCDACLMNYLGTPFGAVAAEQLPVRLYRGGWQGPAGKPRARLELIEPGSATPAASRVVVAPRSTKRLAVRVMGPQGANTRVVWTVDGKVVKKTKVKSGTVVRYQVTGARKARKVVVRATDVAGILHPSIARMSTSKRAWEISPR